MLIIILYLFFHYYTVHKYRQDYTSSVIGYLLQHKHSFYTRLTRRFKKNKLQCVVYEIKAFFKRNMEVFSIPSPKALVKGFTLLMLNYCIESNETYLLYNVLSLLKN